MDNNIIGITLSKDPPEWQSSTPTPEEQLEDLGNMGPYVGDFRDYNYDLNLANLLRGKRVAYVCPSPHLTGQGLGPKIDSYDLVVRINQSYCMPEELWADYGRRTDILVNCLNEHKIRALLCQEGVGFVQTLQYIICPMVSMWDIGRVDEFLFASSHLAGTPGHNVCDGYLFKIFKEVGTTCNTGLTGIITLLNYDIEELFVTGMTFFNMNTFGKVYYDKYYDEAVKNKNFEEDPNKEPTTSDLRIDIHQQQPQIDYFRKIVNHYHDSVLTLDEYLTENFVK
tara:strand:- start:1313 stop:2158 length:846 start_codon:yes stop_codon:yes gene_type:complete